MKIFKGLLSHNTTNGFNLVEFENSLGFEFEINYIENGIYGIVSNGNFVEGKTILEVGNYPSADIHIDVLSYDNAPNEMRFQLYSISQNQTVNNGLQYLPITIIVLDETPYTDTELSAICHAKSILYRAGLKNLAELL